MPEVLRIYNPRRGRAHLTDGIGTMVTFCGIWPPEGWLGTHSLDEQDEAYQRRLCHRCYRRAMWRAG